MEESSGGQKSASITETLARTSLKDRSCQTAVQLVVNRTFKTELLILKKALRKWYMKGCQRRARLWTHFRRLLLDYFEFSLWFLQLSSEPAFGKTLATRSAANKSKSNLSMTLLHGFYVIDRIYLLDVVYFELC